MRVKADGSPYYSVYAIANIMRMTKRFYNYLLFCGRVLKNPFSKVKRIKTGRRLPRNIPNEEKTAVLLDYLSRFWEHAHVRDRRIYYKIHVMAEVMYSTAMRIEEMKELASSDIDYERRTIRVRRGKGGRERIVFLNEYAASVLKLYVEKMRETTNARHNKNVFGVAGLCGMVQTANKFLKAAAARCGIGRFTSHMWRHTLGYHLLKRGCDMRYIQIILGHEDMNTTTIYTRVDKSELRNELDIHHPRRFVSTKENPS
jgi:integrase/recombinase XerD